jgi:hypothetical protein
MELDVSNDSCAEYSLLLNHGPGGCFAQHHPNENLQEGLRVAEMGEPAYNKVRLQKALTWIDHNRSRFLVLTMERFVAFWLPNVTSELIGLSDQHRGGWTLDFFTLLSIPGVFLKWRKDRHAATLLLAWFVCFPPIYYLIQVEARYRHPILWATLLPGAYTLAIAGGTLLRKASGDGRPLTSSI